MAGGKHTQNDCFPRTLKFEMLVIHEEAVNQHLGLAYFGGIFSDGKASVRALDCIPEGPYPVRATLDLAGFWKMRGFSWFSVVHLLGLLACEPGSVSLGA
jgi:hypothetical protein